MRPFFSEREGGPRSRTVDTVNGVAWGGLYALVRLHLGDGGFGHGFPLQCRDVGKGPYAVDEHAFGLMLQAKIPALSWPLTEWETPSTATVMDLVEFAAAAIGTPVRGSYHKFDDHFHLTWDRDAGLAAFVDEVNGIFGRNGLAFELTPGGTVRRLLPESLSEPLASTVFATGDHDADQCLERARALIASPKPELRQDALEKLWDAFERLKTLGPGADKKAQADALLDLVAGPGTRMRQVLADEARALTAIGNTFRIRHAETDQEALTDTAVVDFLFTRMFAWIQVVLRATGRGG